MRLLTALSVCCAPATAVVLQRQRRGRAKLHTRAKVRSVSSMQIVHKTAYWGEIAVGGGKGGEKEAFNVIFDTGSGNLILPGSKCTTPGCASHKKYNLSGTKITNDSGESEAEISFGTGNISGEFYKDGFCVGSSNAGSDFCVPDGIGFIAATDQSTEPFSETPFDGILGLGFKDLSMGAEFNIVDQLQSSAQIFSFALSDSTGDSSITFGGYRRSLLAFPNHDLVWAPVTHPSYWQIQIDDITFNNQPTGLCSNNGEGCQVAVDTGTSMLAGPTDLVEKLSEQIDVKDDCSNFTDLKKLGFQIGDKILNLFPEEYVDKDDGQFPGKSTAACSFSLMALDVPPPKGPLFIFGDPFLRRFVTVFDRKNMRVGFGIRKQSNVASPDYGVISDVVSGDQNYSPSGTDAVSAAALTDGNQSVVSLEGGMMLNSDGGAAGAAAADDASAAPPAPESSGEDASAMKSIDSDSYAPADASAARNIASLANNESAGSDAAPAARAAPAAGGDDGFDADIATMEKAFHTQYASKSSSEPSDKIGALMKQMYVQKRQKVSRVHVDEFADESHLLSIPLFKREQ